MYRFWSAGCRRSHPHLSPLVDWIYLLKWPPPPPLRLLLAPPRPPKTQIPDPAARLRPTAAARTARLSVTSVWTPPRTRWSACADTSSVGHACISGWRPDPTDKCVRCVKLASVETKLFHYMGGEAQVNKTPEKEHPLDHKDKGRSQKTVVASKGLALAMGVSRCRLESVPFRLVFLRQLSTSMMGDLLQRPRGRHSTWTNSFCLDSSCLSPWWSCSGCWSPKCTERHHLWVTQKKTAPMWLCLHTLFGSLIFFVSLPWGLNDLMCANPRITTFRVNHVTLVAWCFNLQGNTPEFFHVTLLIRPFYMLSPLFCYIRHIQEVVQERESGFSILSRCIFKEISLFFLVFFCYSCCI